MRAALIKSPHGIILGELPSPEPAAGEVRVNLEATGICGTDLHLLAAGLLPDGHTPGHEMAGRVDRLGPGVLGWREGQRVVIEPFHACGECVYCERGDDQICPSLALYGVHLRGGLAEQIVVPAHRIYAAPEELRPELCALAEPLAVAVHGLHRGNLQEGQRVLVIGAGAVGLATTLAARAMGAEVFQTARYQAQAELAEYMGASRVLREEEAGDQALGALGSQTPFDVVVETVGGQAQTLLGASHAVRPGGTISVVGVFLGQPRVEALPLLIKEGTLAWSHCYSRGSERSDFDAALEIISDERERLERFASHTVPLAEIERAFALAADKKAGVIKVSVVP